MTKPWIYCKMPKNEEKLAFYLEFNGEKYFLFNQNRTDKVEAFFRNGVTLDRAIDMSASRNDFNLQKVMSKLLSYIKYIEKEYEIAVLRRSVYA